MAKSLLAPHGYSRLETEDGAVVMMNLYTCCHCQATWEAEVGSLGGKLAGGYCGKCDGFFCKNPDCRRLCVPWEQRLENIEAGRPLLAERKIIIPAPDMGLLHKR
jgi:hypothetical protein